MFQKCLMQTKQQLNVLHWAWKHNHYRTNPVAPGPYFPYVDAVTGNNVNGSKVRGPATQCGPCGPALARNRTCARNIMRGICRQSRVRRRRRCRAWYNVLMYVASVNDSDTAQFGWRQTAAKSRTTWPVMGHADLTCVCIEWNRRASNRTVKSDTKWTLYGYCEREINVTAVTD